MAKPDSFLGMVGQLTTQAYPSASHGAEFLHKAKSRGKEVSLDADTRALGEAFAHSRRNFELPAVDYKPGKQRSNPEACA